MLAKANKAYESNAPARGSQLAKQPFPSSSPSAPKASIRDQLKNPGFASTSARTPQPFSNLQNRSMNMNQSPANRPPAAEGRLASLYTASNSIKKESMIIDLTEPEARAKAHEAVFFAEDDFSDDDMLDLDYEAPSALPPLLSITASKPVSFNSIPPPKSTPNETKISWPSSPASHLVPPTAQRTMPIETITEESSLKRESSGDQDPLSNPVQKKAKRRVLPVSFRQEDPEEDESYNSAMQTPVSKPKFEPWDATTSAVKEQKKQLKTQRQQKEAQENIKEDQEDTQEYGPSLANIPTIGKSLTKKSFAFSLSDEQKNVLDLVVNKGSSVFFTGPAGTGKSVLMRAIITALKEKYARDPERVAVTASTGLAACNIGGITLHSFSGIGLGKEDAPTLVKKIRRNPKAKNRWLKTQCLVVDEISMVDGDLFDKLDKIGRTIRANGRPWGGIQVIITGDFFQLPPVPDSSKRETKFAFDASTWSTSIDHTIGLTQVFRQRDPQFAQMLNEMRLGKISEDTVRAFKALSRPLNFNDGLGMAELFSTRAEVEGSNEKRLNDLKGTAKRFDAQDSGDPAIREKLLMNMMAPKSIVLKVGAQVMLIKNLDESLVNGSLGKVIAFADEKTFDMTTDDSFSEDPTSKARRKLKAFSHEADVRPKRSGNLYPVVQFMTSHGTQRTILCVPEDWKVELPNGEVQAKRTQLPLILAWALSIHKAQGQTLERVKVNLGRVFEKGQAYVALSRATTQEGLQVVGFDKWKVMAHPRVVSFYNQLYSAEEASKKKPGSIGDFLTNRIGPAAPKTEVLKKEAPKRETPTVINLDDDEEAMASYGY